MVGGESQFLNLARRESERGMSDEASGLICRRGESPHGRTTGKPAPQKAYGLKEANFKRPLKESLQRGHTFIVHTRIVLPERGCHSASASFLCRVVICSCEKLLREE